MIGAIGFHHVAALEEARAARTGRGFTLVRLAPVGWSALDEQLDVFAYVLAAELRETDFVQRTRHREVGVVLVETTGDQLTEPLDRIRAVTEDELGKGARIGWATVGPGHWQSWEEAWKWAGQLLVADAAVPAAA